MRIYATSDWHFHHRLFKRLVELRPTNYEELIIERYCEIVTDEDIVMILGDQLFQGEKTRPWFSHLMQTMPGYKVLVPGNHDQPKSFKLRYWKDECGFQKVYCGGVVVGDVLFSHIPIINDNPNDNRYEKLIEKLHRMFVLGQCKLNIHGHTHTWKVSSDKCLGVSLEQTDYRPLDITEYTSPTFKSDLPEDVTDESYFKDNFWL